MAQVYKFSEKEIEEIVQARRENKDKRAEARLKALEMRAIGAKGSEIAAASGFHSAYASQLAAKYKKYGIEAISGNHYGGNHRNMSAEDEAAAWHKAGGLEIPDNIELLHIPPYTPEMNPLEQIWKEIRKRGFRNEVFAALSKAMDRLSDTICSLSNQTAACVAGRGWILKCFN